MRSAPSPVCWHPLGHAAALSRDPLSTLLSWMREHGELVRIRIGRRTAYVVFHPELVRHVLQEHHKTYTKSTPGYRTLKLFLGEGLLTSDGAHWKRQRRLIQPSFHRDRMNGFATIMTDAAERALERWSAFARAGTPVDMAEEMMWITMQVILGALFSADLPRDVQRIAAAIGTLQREANRRTSAPFELPARWPTPGNRRLWAARDTIESELLALIRQRRDARKNGANAASDGAADDLLAMLVHARDAETGEAMTESELRDEIITLFLAGHESTANSLTWTWYLLSKHPDVARRVRSELDTVLSGRTPAMDDVPNLKVTRAVIQESLRLYPPAWSIGRAPAQDDVIAGYSLASGTLVILSAWATHRHPDFWQNPEGFDPDRFLAESAELPRYKYFPFGAGPRTCIGASFALLEAQLVLATLAQHFSADLVVGQRIEAEPLITLRPRHGMKMLIRSCERS